MRKTQFANTVLLLSMILIISLTSFSKDKAFRSQWAAEPVKIDGISNDWAKVALANEKKVKVDYAFQNDAENLYILFIFKDPKYLSSIGSTGITVWLNSEGKKDKDFGIRFIQNQVSAEELITRLEKEKGPLPEDEKKKIRDNPSYLINDTEIINKEDEPGSQPSESSETKPAVFRVMKQQNALVLEFAISFEKKPEEAPEMIRESGKNLKVGFEWGGMTKEMKAEVMRRSAALERSRTSGGDAADNRASGGAESTGPMGLLSGPKEYSFWVDVILGRKEIE